MIERVRGWPDLYFMWWHCVRGFRGRGWESVRFSEALGNDAPAVAALRGMLVAGLHSPGIDRLSNQEVVAEAARRIVAGELLVIREGTPWGVAMRGFHALPGAFLLWRYPASGFWDRTGALRLLSSISRDSLALAAFRRLLSANMLNRGFDRARDAQVVEEIARLLVSGDLLVGWEPMPWGAGAAEREEWRAAPVHEPVVVPRARRVWQGPSHVPPPVEPPVFAAGHDGAAQAAALVAAAEHGAGWCDI